MMTQIGKGVFEMEMNRLRKQKRPIKVHELIAILATFDPNATIEVVTDDDQDLGAIFDVCQQKCVGHEWCSLVLKDTWQEVKEGLGES